MAEAGLFSAIRHVIVLVGSSLFIAAAAAASSVPLLGVAPQDVSYYNSGPILWCKDRSKRFSIDRLNDDFCDCPDATDEPGTSACPNGRFFCKNQKQLPFWVFSSRVNDGICDCCDGSDEYDGKVQCEPACLLEAGDLHSHKESSKDAELKTSWKNSVNFFSSSEEPDGASRPKYLKMLVVLEVVLVLMALRQFYTWTCRRGTRLRRGLPR